MRRPQWRGLAFTGRAAILLVALASVALALAVPLRVYLGQRHAISALVQQQQQDQRQLAALRAEQRAWQNPAYVEQQARQRLHMLLPGQQGLLVFGNRTSPAGAARAAAAKTANRPWYGQLWGSLQSAGAPATTTRTPRR